MSAAQLFFHQVKFIYPTKEHCSLTTHGRTNLSLDTSYRTIQILPIQIKVQLHMIKTATLKGMEVMDENNIESYPWLRSQSSLIFGQNLRLKVRQPSCPGGRWLNWLALCFACILTPKLETPDQWTLNYYSTSFILWKFKNHLKP